MSANEYHCEIYLTLPHDPGPDAAGRVEGLLRDRQIACVLLRANEHGSVERPLADDLREVAHRHETAFLVESDLEAALALEADGIHLGADPGLLARARSALGEDQQIGVSCGLQRHIAMEMGELGADYVAFDAEGAPMEALGETIEWWAEIFLLPCIAWGLTSVQDALSCAGQGADFVALHEDLWSSPAELSAMMAELDTRFAQARDAA